GIRRANLVDKAGGSSDASSVANQRRHSFIKLYRFVSSATDDGYGDKRLILPGLAIASGAVYLDVRPGRVGGGYRVGIGNKRQKLAHRLLYVDVICLQNTPFAPEP